jgi:non-ribosomal peptide synthetase component F
LLEIPTDYPRPAIQTSRGAHASFTVSKEVSETLKTLGQQENATLFMVLLAAFKTLLYRYSGQEDITVGTGIANRPQVELESLIGLFVNTLALRSDLSGNPTFRELLQRVRETTHEAYACQDVPFETLVEVLQPARNPSYTPLFQVMLVLQNAQMGSLELPGLVPSSLGFENKTAKFDLYLSLTESPDGIHGSLEYNIDLFSDSTIARITQHFQAMLADIAANPDEEISRLSITTHEESRQLIYDFNEG